MEAATPELTKALVKFQSEMSPIKREAKNPGFKRADGRPSTYADFASTVEAIREPMSECGLAFTQLLGGGPDGITVTTILMHISGESVRGTAWSPVTQQTPQAVGSATTYLKRYGLWAILGLATEDDDGQEASRPVPKSKPVPPPKPAPKPVDTAKIVAAFAGLGIPLAHLEDRLETEVARWTEADVESLRKYHKEKKALASESADAKAARLEAEKAEAGIAAEAQMKKEIDARNAALAAKNTDKEPTQTPVSMITAPKPVDGPAKADQVERTKVFTDFVARIRATTTTTELIQVGAEYGLSKLPPVDLKLLSKEYADRLLVLQDKAKESKRPRIPVIDVPA